MFYKERLLGTDFFENQLNMVMYDSLERSYPHAHSIFMNPAWSGMVDG